MLQQSCKDRDTDHNSSAMKIAARTIKCDGSPVKIGTRTVMLRQSCKDRNKDHNVMLLTPTDVEINVFLD